MTTAISPFQWPYREPTMNDELKVGMNIPVYGQQIRGCYLEENGQRYSHFAVPGWYQIASIDGAMIVLQTIPVDGKRIQKFECGADAVKAVLFANIEHYTTTGIEP